MLLVTHGLILYDLPPTDETSARVLDAEAGLVSQ
jgi:hypothetical protein